MKSYKVKIMSAKLRNHLELQSSYKILMLYEVSIGVYHFAVSASKEEDWLTQLSSRFFLHQPLLISRM